MPTKALQWMLDKSGGAIVGAIVTAIGEYIYAATSGNPNAAAVLIGATVAGFFAVVMLVVAFITFKEGPTEVANGEEQNNALAEYFEKQERDRQREGQISTPGDSGAASELCCRVTIS